MRRKLSKQIQPLRMRHDYGETENTIDDEMIDNVLSKIRKEAKENCRGCGKKVAVGWDNFPAGWTKESVEKYWNTLTGKVKHKVTKCHKEMQKHFGDEGAWGFCASLADMVEGTTKWRGEE